MRKIENSRIENTCDALCNDLFSIGRKRGIGIIIALMFIMIFGSVCFRGNNEAEAKTFIIKTPKQLRSINWKGKGYGPGHTYIIGNDFTLGERDNATCRLTKGKFNIDFNGHTVQNANPKMGVFSISGANVTMKDSKASKTRPSVRSYGAGGIDMTSGNLTVNSGTYTGISNGSTNPVGIHVGGGKCTINGGYIYGDVIGADCSNAVLRINGGTFQTGYMFALADLGNAKIKIAKGKFISATTTYGYKLALGAMDLQHVTYNFNKWLAKGSSYSYEFQTGYWNMQSQMDAQPSYFTNYAVAFNTPEIDVVSNVKRPASTSLKSLRASGKNMNASWKKQTNNTSGYILQLSTSKKFSKNNKTLVINNNKTTKTKISKLKSGKKYYARIRTYKSQNGTKIYSSWSKIKSSKTR